MPNTSHYDLGSWTDYARNMLPDEQRAVMQRHLDVCSECHQTVMWLKEVAKLASAEPKVPADVVLAAKGVFGGRRPVRERFSSLSRMACRLMYDSFASPATAGARSMRQASRHVLYQAGEYHLDLRVERETESRGVVLTGQMASDLPRGETLSGAEVLVQHGTSTVAETVTNDFGEFCLECIPRRDLQLCIPLYRVSKKIELSLNLLLGYK